MSDTELDPRLVQAFLEIAPALGDKLDPVATRTAVRAAERPLATRA